MPHKLGQVFLIDQNIIQKIVHAENITKDDNVVEIGCGDGILSKPLAQQAKQLSIIEIDKKCIISTQNTCKDFSNILYIHQDILTVDLSTLYVEPYYIMANIPYYLSAKIIQHFVAYRDSLKRITIMVQKEFAKKLVATSRKKEHTSLTLYTQFYFEIKWLFDVSNTCFKPIPKVDSSVIQLTPLKTKRFDVDENIFFKLIQSSFWGRRKTLLSALKKSPFLSFKKGLETCDFFQKHQSIRGETLDLSDFYVLYKELESKDFFLYSK